VVGGTILGFDRSEYIRLVVQFPPVKIRTAEQAKATESRIEVLLEQPNLSQAEDSYVDLLSDLLADWEDATVTIPDIDGVELRRALLEDRGLRQKDSVEVWGSKITPAIGSTASASILAARYWLHFLRRNREPLGLASVDGCPGTRLCGHSGRGTRSFPGGGQSA